MWKVMHLKVARVSNYSRSLKALESYPWHIHQSILPVPVAEQELLRVDASQQGLILVHEEIHNLVV